MTCAISHLGGERNRTPSTASAAHPGAGTVHSARPPWESRLAWAARPFWFMSPRAGSRPRPSLPEDRTRGILTADKGVPYARKVTTEASGEEARQVTQGEAGSEARQEVDQDRTGSLRAPNSSPPVGAAAGRSTASSR